MKKRPLIIGSTPNRKSLPLILSVMTASFGLAVGSASAQTQESDRYTSDRAGEQQRQQETTGTAGDRQSDSESYTVVVWDPVTGSWTHVIAREQAQTGDRQQAQGTSGQAAGRDRDATAGQSYGPGTQRPGTGQTQTQMQQERDSRQQATTRQQQERQQQARQDAWRDTRRQTTQQQQQETVDGKGAASIQGQVQGFREVSLRRGQGVPQDHTWVRLKLQSGYESIVDLGPEKDLSDLDMGRGDTVRVTGRHASISGQNVLIADRIRVGGETINIDRKKSKQEVSGKIRDFSEVNIQDSEYEDYLVVRLRMEDGKEVTTALGKDASVNDFDIEQDARVKIEGERKMVDGRPILIARKVTVEGDTTQIGKDGEVRDQD